MFSILKFEYSEKIGKEEERKKEIGIRKNANLPRWGKVLTGTTPLAHRKQWRVVELF